MAMRDRRNDILGTKCGIAPEKDLGVTRLE